MSDRETAHSCPPILARLGRFLLRWLRENTATDSVPDQWYLDDWRAGLEYLKVPWGDKPQPQQQDLIKEGEQRHRKPALDDASRRYLEVVQPCLDLRSVWPQLTPDQWRATDVIFQTQGPLLNAPLAWLDFGPGTADRADATGKLFEHVASTGTVISLTLRDLASRGVRGVGTPTKNGKLELASTADMPGTNPTNEPPPRRVLATFWDAAAVRPHGMLDLRQRLIATGREHKWPVYCLDDAPDPRATADNLRSALNQSVDDEERRFGVVVINAHGVAQTFGVKLADGTCWQGDGANLQWVDLLVLSACSVGRLEQDGARDVEGLYVKLAAHHGRAVIAARWPIADNETAIFTEEIVRQYIARAEANPTAPTPPFARARALNAARRRLLENDDITFHLASAFEIYGLG